MTYRALLRAALPLCLVSLLLPAAAGAQARAVRLTHYADPTRTIGISWNSSGTSDDQVILGTSSDALDRMITATETHAIGGELGTSYTAEIDGLEPGTTYYYRVGRAGAWRPADGSPPSSFRTLPADRCAPLRIIVIGDNRSDFDGTPNSLWPDILDEAMTQMPDLFINTGDMVKNGDAIGEWSDFIDDSESGFSQVATIATMGNHDEDDINGDGAIYNQLFAFPRNSTTDTEDYYSIDVGPIHFVSLNTQFTSPGSTELMQMVAWLESDLSAASQPWTIVYFHKAVYSRGNHHTGEDNSGSINASFTPVFDAHGVDLVLNGHSHDYERYAPTVGLDPEFGGTARTFPGGNGAAIAALSTVPDGAVGTTYIVTGGAGALTTAGIPGLDFCEDLSCTYCDPFGIIMMCDQDVVDRDRDATVVFNGLHGFVTIDVDGADLHVESRATEAGNLGRGGRVIDSFTMTHSAWPADVCGTTPPPTDGGVPGTDGGTPGADAGPGFDAGPGSDAGTTPGRDAGGTGGSDDGGCGCRLAAPPRGTPLSALAVVALAALLRRRRRR